MNNIKLTIDKIIISEIEKMNCEDVDYLDKTFEGKNMFTDLKFDSVSIIHLISEIEEKFGIQIPTERLIECLSEYDLIVECIEEIVKH